LSHQHQAPVSFLKGTHVYLGPTWIIWDNLLISKS
jgi:hypothetical protein